jgi:hypothetical protein
MSAALSLFHLLSLPLVDTQLSAPAHHTFLLRGRSKKRPLHASIQTEHIQAGACIERSGLMAVPQRRAKHEAGLI